MTERKYGLTEKGKQILKEKEANDLLKEVGMDMEKFVKELLGFKKDT